MRYTSAPGPDHRGKPGQSKGADADGHRVGDELADEPHGNHAVSKFGQGRIPKIEHDPVLDLCGDPIKHPGAKECEGESQTEEEMVIEQSVLLTRDA